MKGNGSAAHGQDSKPRIMVVDDDPANLQVIRMVVVREKFLCDLILFENGQAGLDYLNDHRVDLILLDVVMPGMNGFEMFAKLRENPAWAEIPVIFLSAIQEPEYIIRGFEMGASDYVGKPIISQVLTARIRAVLRINFLQNELKERNAELEGANSLKDEFLSICSHDLRAPLSAIDLTCQLLNEESGGLSDSSSELVGRIVNQTRLARRLVENILDLNKIEEGRLVPHPTFFSIQELLDGCVVDQQPIILAKNIDFAKDMQSGAAVCYGDRDMIAQMVRNVLDNAIKFARNSVSVSSHVAELDAPEGGRWDLVVRDDGVGFKPEQAETLFHKYVTTNSNDAGYGLGLYISQQTVKMHNGSISVQSVPDEATTLAIRLPMIFDPDSLPDLSEISHASVRIFTSSRDTGVQMENILLEGGLVDVSIGSMEGENQDQITAPLPDVVIIDMQSPPQDYYPLVRLMNNGTVATRWIFLGTLPELEEIAMLTSIPIGRMPRPLNPAICLRMVKTMMREPPAALLTRLA
ncbi:MAG: hybrid sensor histidine kinase/response regulator [SAR324 cluster bacterium]|nr:hybrid sensor histidine kinase/response regulator [SAR324 cluster bacterium]